MQRHGRTHGRCNLAHQAVVHLHLLSHSGLTTDRVYGTGLLDEPEAVHLAAQKEPHKVAVTGANAALLTADYSYADRSKTLRYNDISFKKSLKID